MAEISLNYDVTERTAEKLFDLIKVVITVTLGITAFIIVNVVLKEDVSTELGYTLYKSLSELLWSLVWQILAALLYVAIWGVLYLPEKKELKRGRAVAVFLLTALSFIALVTSFFGTTSAYHYFKAYVDGRIAELEHVPTPTEMDEILKSQSK